MRFAIIGCGRFGQEILEWLIEDEKHGNHEIYCIEEDCKIVDDLNDSQDIMALQGSGTDIALLEQIEMSKIDYCIACTGSDEINALACIYAKKMGAKHTITRILNYDHNTPGARFLKDKCSLELLVNPLYQTAKAIHTQIRKDLKKGAITILGANKISYYLAKELHKDGVYSIKILDNDTVQLDALCAALPEEVILCNGDIADHDVLISEGLLDSKGFVSCSDLDEENILTSLFALEHDIPCIITKINKTSYIDIVKDLNLHNVISPIGATAEIIINYIDRTIQDSIEQKKKDKEIKNK